jgi:hypothetical protein
MNEMEIDDREFQLLVKEALKLTAVEAEIVTTDPKVKDYWPVLEYGSREGQRPWPRSGPRTRRSQGRVFSRQGVGGFVRKHANIFIRFLSDAIKRNADHADGFTKQSDLAATVNEAADKSLEFLKKTAPVDEGTLRDSLTVKKA